MSFDPSTAKPVEEFDPSSAQPAESSLPGIVNYNPGVGVAEMGLALGTGAVGAVAGGFSGLAQGATNALGLTKTPAGDRVRQVSEALTYEPRSAAGKALTGGISMPFEALANVADKAGGAVTDATGSPMAGAAVNTAIQSAPMGLVHAARALPGESSAAVKGRLQAKALNAPKDAGIAAAREAGLRVTPTEAGAGQTLRAVESISGEPRLAKLHSNKNAPIINQLIRKDLGLPDDVPLSRDALSAIRKEEGANYEVVKSVGRFGTDAKYQADLHKITNSFDTAAKDFAHRSENPFKKTMDGLNVKNIDATSAVEEVKLLRADADKAFRGGDKQLGKAYKEAAQALDDQLDRHLKGLGDPAMADAVAKYQAARQRIAKTYAAEKALDDSTGNISAIEYGKALKKGAPLTGGARQVGEFAQQFPRSTQRGTAATGPTIFDAALGLIFGEPMVGQSALARGAAGLTARPLARSALSSPPLQSIITSPNSYGPPRIRRLQDLIADVGLEASLVGTPAGQQK